MEENFNDSEEMSIQEKTELEDLMVDTAFRNSFLILTGRQTLKELLNLNKEDDDKISAICAHEPGEEVEIDTLENMLIYFEDTEEYEKCVEIKNIMDVRI